MARKTDKEIDLYRNLLEPATEFEDAFGWSTVAGIIFCGLVMLPGSIYLGLMTGGSMAGAATWVTVILFSEVARRAMKTMSKQELVMLLHAAGLIMAGSVLFPGGPLGQIVYRAYLVTSDTVRDLGMRDYFPTWWVPKPDSPAITERNLFHVDWLLPISIAGFMMLMGFMQKYTLGYIFFRITSDIEELPFPLAPIQAQGAMALAEAEENPDDESVINKGREAFMRSRKGQKKKSEKWRLFSLGATIGIAFGFFQIGVPAITGLLFETPIYIIPLPFIDTTTLTETILPATPTGLTIDIGIIMVGFVIPFWAIMGVAIAIFGTMMLNPLLHNLGVLTNWQEGMNTVNTTFANQIDFWMSFGIGSAFGLVVVSLYQTIRDVRAKVKKNQAKRSDRDRKFKDSESIWKPPTKGRGDYPLWLAIGGYVVGSIVFIVVTYTLIKDSIGSPITIILFFTVFVFVYNPLISYINARLLGIAGQTVDVPFIRETAFILSGASGISIWLAPVPIMNMGHQAQQFRVNELTGLSFRSLVKLDLVAQPTLFLLSWFFWAFIWYSTPVPSQAFPAAQINWELKTKQDTLLYTSTFVVEGQEDTNIMESQFMTAIHPKVIGGSFFFTILLFTLLSIFGLPVMLVYGIIRGLGQFPHYMFLEVFGALLGRFYFQRKFGRSNFLRMAPTILAGYATGVGLIGMATIAMRLIKNAVSVAPF